MTYKVFTKGQKVRSIFGKTYTVIDQNGCQVFVDDLTVGHVHPSKIFAI